LVWSLDSSVIGSGWQEVEGMTAGNTSDISSDIVKHEAGLNLRTRSIAVFRIAAVIRESNGLLTPFVSFGYLQEGMECTTV
jgi:hypothetical protein